MKEKKEPQYEFLYENLMRMDKNKLDITDEDSFATLVEKNGGDENINTPLVKYHEKKRAPEGIPERVLKHISYLLLNDFELPRIARYYLGEAINKYLNKGCGLEEALFLNLKYRNFSEEKKDFIKNVNNYLYFRLVIMKIIGIEWDDILLVKGDDSFLEQLSDELSYLYKINAYSKTGEELNEGISLSRKSIKSRIENQALNNRVVFPLSYYKEDICCSGCYQEYKSYLKFKQDNNKKVTYFPRTIDELELIEKFSEIPKCDLPADKSFQAWYETLIHKKQ